MKTKKIVLYFIALSILILGVGCKKDPIVPVDPPVDPPIVEKTPLELAFESFQTVTSYTMNITFESNSNNSYIAKVKMTESSAEVEALDEVIYYEISQDLCYIYEFKATTWDKSLTSCTDKTSQELGFLNDFDVSYFEVDLDGNYKLKPNYYDSLDGFLQSTSTSDFKLTVVDNKISSIHFTMIRNNFTFTITMTLSNINQTTVILPTV